MSRVVIVARTRMRNDHVCIGGHDLDRGFRGVRLLDRFGRYWTSDSLFAVGEIWLLRYRTKPEAIPHVEDVAVLEHRRVGPVLDLKALVLERARPWRGPPDALFDGTVRGAPSGTAYVPGKGRLPRGSTGFWLPDSDLAQRRYGERVRFVWSGKGAIRGFSWVGVGEPPERIEAGSLARVSLSHRFVSETAPDGYYVQISGVL